MNGMACKTEGFKRLPHPNFLQKKNIKNKYAGGFCSSYFKQLSAHLKFSQSFQASL